MQSDSTQATTTGTNPDLPFATVRVRVGTTAWLGTGRTAWHRTGTTTWLGKGTTTWNGMGTMTLNSMETMAWLGTETTTWRSCNLYIRGATMMAPAEAARCNNQLQAGDGFKLVGRAVDER